MDKIKKIFIYACLIVLLLLGVSYYYSNISKTVLFPANVKKGVEKYWHKNVSIVAERDLVLNGKNYKLILSTASDDKSYKYLNVYEQKIGGLYYKSLQASEQGKSIAKISFMLLAARNGLKDEKEYTIVYGYNKALAIDSYEIKTVVGKDSKEKIEKGNISEKEYFIDSYDGYIKDIVSCTDKDGNSMMRAFLD